MNRKRVLLLAVGLCVGLGCSDGTPAGTDGAAGSGAAGTGAGGQGGRCNPPLGEWCKAKYADQLAEAMALTCGGVLPGPCARAGACGADQLVWYSPNFEASYSCLYDAQGVLIGATGSSNEFASCLPDGRAHVGASASCAITQLPAIAESTNKDAGPQ